MKKTVILVSIVVVILIFNIDKIIFVDDYIKAIILFVLAGLLSVYEYKRDKRTS